MFRKFPFHLLSLVILSILFFASLCQAKTYHWHDFTVPFVPYSGLDSIKSGSVEIIRVELPAYFIENYEEITLIIRAEGGDNTNTFHTRSFTINDKKDYRFSVPFDKQVICRVNIKTKFLKKGHNKLQFKGSGIASGGGYSIKKLRFDIAALENFKAYIEESRPLDQEDKKEKKQSAQALKRDNNPPKIIITSHDISRGLKAVEIKKIVKITGKVIDENSIVEIIVNGKEAQFNIAGNFETDVYLGLGENKITVSAMDRFENRAYKSFTIVRKNFQSKAKREKNIVPTERYFALIIGNNNYMHLPKLQTAINDAQTIENLLKTQFGFKTSLLVDVGRDDIIRVINIFRKKLKNNDNFLIYYAGHGVFDKSANKAYWLPVDAKRDDDTDWIIADTITSNLKRIASNHIIIVSDSCYSGTFTRRGIIEFNSTRIRSRYLEKMRKKKSRTLLASGGNEPVSDIGGEGHSVFANAFIKGLNNIEQAEFTAEELYFHHIREVVAGDSEQTPEYSIIRNSGHMGGDFYFKRTK